ncbi:MAG: porin [Oceanicola sp.]|nr:porin [Oceanicola sp.]
MKKILLASAASFAFAGAAAADITFSGSANVGFGELNDDSTGGALNGATGAQMYQNISLTTTMSGETDTGLAFGASITFRNGDDIDLDAGDLDYDGDLSTASFGNVFISGDWGKLTFDRNGLDNLWNDDFSHDIQYDYSFDAFSFSLTYDIDGSGDSEEWSAKISYALDAFDASLATDDSGEFDITLGYQITSEIKVSLTNESDTGENTLKGVYDDGTFNASLAISDTDSEWDLGLGYTANGIAIAANYGDQDTGDESWDLSASYDLGGGLTVKAMTNESDAYYVGLAMSF